LRSARVSAQLAALSGTIAHRGVDLPAIDLAPPALTLAAETQKRDGTFAPSRLQKSRQELQLSVIAGSELKAGLRQ
jgi:hypothetical protein